MSGTESVGPTPVQGGSILDFSKAMRAVAQGSYESRQKKEKGITDKQFDATKVSGNIFAQIMGNVEARRGGDISKIYGSAVDAAKFDIENKRAEEEAARSAALQQQKMEEEKRQYNLTYYQNNGEFPSDITDSQAGFASPTQANGMPWRTDRNNNPIAAAVTLGGKNQFTNALDKAGIEWTYGDGFPDNPNMRTIKILGNGIEAARAILANTNSIQGWYAKASSGQILRETGIMNNQQFASLSVEDQNKIIIGIYKGETGNGSLVKDILPENKKVEASDEVRAWAEAIKNKTATMASVPKNQKDKVAVELNRINQAETSATEQITLDALDLANELIKHPGRKGATGFIGNSWIPGTDAKDFAVGAQSLVDKLTLDLIPTMKGMGALSDAEGARLERAGSMLKDRSISEAAYLRELERIRDVLTAKVSNKGIKKNTKVNISEDNITAIKNKYGITY